MSGALRHLVLFFVLLSAWSTTAQAQNPPKPVVVIGLRPTSGTSVEGPSDIRRLSEAQRLRRVLNDVTRAIAQRPIIDDNGLRTLLGVNYLVDFMGCVGKVDCVSRVVGRLKSNVPFGIYGDYALNQKSYVFRIRLVDIANAKVVKQVDFKLEDSDKEDRKLWQRELEPLLAALPAGAAAPGGGGTPPGGGGTPPGGGGTPPGGGGTPPGGGGTPPGGGGEPGGGSGSGAGSGEPGGGGSGSATPPGGGGAINNGGGDTGLPELAPIISESPGGGGGKDFVDSSVLDLISHGLTWHGHFQSYTAVGVRESHQKDLVIANDRAQLEFENDVNSVRSVGKPQLLYDALTDNYEFQFRELFVARDYKSFDISAGEQIVTWGVTDFWPVVDLVNPREYRTIRQWRPIDEKIPVASIQSHILIGPLTFHALVVPVQQRSRYTIDQSQPFHLPIPAPKGTTIEQAPEPKNTIWNMTTGLRMDVAIKAWKVSFYGLVGHDVLPAVHADIDPDLQRPTNFVVDNDHIVMGAVSVQGNIDKLGLIVKSEAAYNHRLNDDCAGRTLIVFKTPECFYLRRVPTERVNLGFEKHVMDGLDAHIQLIGQFTSDKDIPRLPKTTVFIAKGLEQQWPFERIVTLRLQGDYKKSDFRPMAFIVWNYDDESVGANVDLEYHLADGFALSLGGFLFEGYSPTPYQAKNKYTFFGSMENSSNAYVKVTAWF